MPNTALASLETKHEMEGGGVGLARLDQACAAFFQACDAAGTDPSEAEQESCSGPSRRSSPGVRR